jgi:hypothetical protein
MPILGVIDSSKLRFESKLAYDSIASSAPSGSSSLEFAAIPQNYTALEIVVFAKTSSTATTYESLNLRLNNATGATDYFTTQFTRVLGTNPSLSVNQQSSSILANESMNSSRTSTPNWTGTWAYQVWRITDYQKTDRWKSVNMFYGYTNSNRLISPIGQVGYLSGTYKSTSAISSIQMFADNAFGSGSNIALYGIKQGL